MNKRPLSVTLIGLLFLIAGVIGVAYHATDFKMQSPFPSELVWVLAIRFLAIVFAIFLLRGKNWARWLLIIWITYHVVLSGFHSSSQLIVHGLLLALVTYFLFRRSASIYFHSLKEESHERTA
jgi:hypothetical protein